SSALDEDLTEIEMAVTVYIPTPFRRATANRDRIDVSAPDIAGVLDELERAYGGLKGLVRNDRGEVHQHVAIYVNSEPIDGLNGLATSLADGDEVAIIPALAGGASVAPRGSSPRESAQTSRARRWRSTLTSRVG